MNNKELKRGFSSSTLVYAFFIRSPAKVYDFNQSPKSLYVTTNKWIAKHSNAKLIWCYIEIMGLSNA